MSVPQEDGNTFEGFIDAGLKSSKICHQLAEAGYGQHVKALPPKHDHISGTAKRKVGRPPKKKPLIAVAEDTKKDTLQGNLDDLSGGQDIENYQPMLSSRPARVIKPSRRFLEQDNDSSVDDLWIPSENCVTQPNTSTAVSNRSSSCATEHHDIALVGYPSQHIPSPEVCEGGDRVSRNISLYADTISSSNDTASYSQQPGSNR